MHLIFITIYIFVHTLQGITLQGYLGMCYGAVIACTLLGGQSLKVRKYLLLQYLAFYLSYQPFINFEYLTLLCSLYTYWQDRFKKMFEWSRTKATH